MSEPKGPRDAKRLAECLADHLAEQIADGWDLDPLLDLAVESPGDGSWARLLGPDALIVHPVDLRIDDTTKLITRLLDEAVDEWLATERLDCAQPSGATGGVIPGTGAPSDTGDGNTTLEHHLADDRTSAQGLWSLLVDSWWRAAPPFSTTEH